jgi:MOSC domain-containing protein YiiM
MMTFVRPTIDAIFVGGPKTLTDAQGEWQSSIQRQRSDGPVHVTIQGIVGDKVTQSYHGGPDAALCVHLADHYRFWRERYGVALAPGAVGENLTLSGLTEEAVCAGDIVRLGTVRAQVRGPRVPCANLGRHIGRSDWVRLTIRENRTGFYLRVLEPGTVQPGDPWIVEQRFDEEASIARINHCMYLNFDPAYAKRIVHMTGIGDWWREQAAEKLVHREGHWTSGIKEE